MKRYLPFILVALVALLAAGGGTIFYRKQLQAQAEAAAAKPKFGKPGAEPPHIRGDKNARVTLEEFGDFECLACAALWTGLAQIEKEYGSRLRVIFREFPLAMHQHGKIAAQAAEAAGLQGRFWEMYDQLYSKRSTWTSAVRSAAPGSNAVPAPGAVEIQTYLNQYAQTIGLDVNRFIKDMAGPEVSKRIASDHERADSLRVDRTPVVFVNEKAVPVSSLNVAGLREVIEAALHPKSPEKDDNPRRP